MGEQWAWGQEGQGKERNEDEGRESMYGKTHMISRYTGSLEEDMKMTHTL